MAGAGGRARAGPQGPVRTAGRPGRGARRGRRGGTAVSRDRGSATVWAALVTTVLGAVFGGVLLLGQAVVARHRAAAAADLSALAAARSWARGPRAACAVALRVARAQDATLTACTVGGENAEVTARAATGPFTPPIRSRAGPPPEPTAEPTAEAALGARADGTHARGPIPGPAPEAAREPPAGEAAREAPTGEAARERTAGRPATGSVGGLTSGVLPEPLTRPVGEVVTGSARQPGSGSAGEPASGSAGEPASGSAGEPASGAVPRPCDPVSGPRGWPASGSAPRDRFRGRDRSRGRGSRHGRHRPSPLQARRRCRPRATGGAWFGAPSQPVRGTAGGSGRGGT
ncbi:Rv3654c family TadE-like protein [Streptomyces antimicrobicus]|uniref:Rv3654c family TadE-like protein n=1 Tax=Streptomyces antimicrobicus TaxID=2883108 RepID=UPI0027E03DC0|nr:Rv3654c family TadE-like protein [Streptomyces antimicrobicus]